MTAFASSAPMIGRVEGESRAERSLVTSRTGVGSGGINTAAYSRNTGGGGRPYVNGNREQTNNYTIDGVDIRDLRFAVHYMYTHDSEVSGNMIEECNGTAIIVMISVTRGNANFRCSATSYSRTA